MGKINQLVGVIGADRLKRLSEEQLKNQEAESAYVRKNVWGSEESGDEVAGEDSMRDTVLGDIIHPTPIVMPQQKASWVAPLMLGALMGGMPLAAYLGYQAGQEKPVAKTPGFDDESVSIGLGHLEDYIKAEPNQ